METGYIKVDPVNVITIVLMAAVGMAVFGMAASLIRQNLPGVQHS